MVETVREENNREAWYWITRTQASSQSNVVGEGKGILEKYETFDPKRSPCGCFSWCSNNARRALRSDQLVAPNASSTFSRVKDVSRQLSEKGCSPREAC